MFLKLSVICMAALFGTAVVHIGRALVASDHGIAQIEGQKAVRLSGLAGLGFLTLYILAHLPVG